MERLTLQQTLKLINRNIIKKDETHLIVDKVSQNNIDEYIITEMFISNNGVKFKVESLRDLSSYIIDYRQIKKIDDMNIKDLLNAYDMGENSITEIDIETDAIKDIIGKEEVVIDGYDLEDNMRIILKKDINSKYCNKILKVKFVDGKITLVSNRGRPKKN